MGLKVYAALDLAENDAVWGTQFQWDNAHNKAPERLTAEEAEEAYREFLREREQAQLQEAVKREKIDKEIRVAWDKAEK